MSTVTIAAPAKVNLGLAVLGKRPDGYHEIDTVMAMIDLADSITLRAHAGRDLVIHGMDDVALSQNLIAKATIAWSDFAGIEPAFEIEVAKRIPAPGGLGGGSSDAAATLRVLNALHGDPLAHDTLIRIAADLGADCPFFLGSSTARATGTGTTLAPLPSPTGWLVLATPPIHTSAKTAALYAALASGDYGSSDTISSIATTLESGRPPATAMLANSFAAPVSRLMQSVADVWTAANGADNELALTGAGPTLFLLETDEKRAHAFAARLRACVAPDVQVSVAAFLQTPPQPVVVQ